MGLEIPWKPKSNESTETDGVVVPAKTKGTLTVRPQSYSERLRFQAKAHSIAQAQKNGQPDHEAHLMMIADLAEKAQAYVVAVDLCLVEDETVKVTTVEELYADPRFDVVVTELATAMMSGFSGNSKSR